MSPGHIFLSIALLIVSSAASAQVFISGSVIDTLGNPIGNASVTYREVDKTIILGFATTKADGSFRLQSKITGIDSVELVVSHLSHLKAYKVVPNATAEHTITLRSGQTILTEVEVDRFPIYKRQDTISYVVDVFTAKQDRVIGDIIRKLPGINVVNGQIYYQGKPIQKYMVNNLDLMEGRYGLINNNLPADVVKKVHVVEDDQPIKVLKSVVPSNRASLNLELKKNVTVSGSGRVGAGTSPALWHLDFTPMILGKTLQSLVSIKTNNIGDDAASNLQSFYTGGHIFRASRNNTDGPSYLSVRNVSSPGFDQSKWLNNELFLGSANVLQKLDDGLEIKGNLSYYTDRRIRRGTTITDVFAPDQHIVLTEAVDNRYRINDLSSGILVEKNEEHVYIRNRLSYEKRWNRDIGDLALNGTDNILQRRVHEDYSLLNSLSMARVIGKNLITIQSDIQMSETPQYLFVEPGQLSDVLNNGAPYDRMRQHITFQGFWMENNLSFVRKIGCWSITPTLIANYISSKLKTDITATLGGKDKQLAEGYLNDMATSRGEFGGAILLDYERGKWKLRGNLPYSLFLFHVEQYDVNTIHQISKSTFQPSLSVIYVVNNRHTLSANTAYIHRFEETDNAYNAYIVSDYRSIQRYSARVLGSRNFSTGMNYRFKNVLNGVFAHAEYSFNSCLQDYLFHVSIDETGQSVVAIANRNGSTQSHALSLGYSHFFQAIKTITKVNSKVGLGWADYLLNDVLARRRNKSWDISVEANCSKWDFIGIMYKVEIGNARTVLALNASNMVHYQNHFLQATFHAGEQHSLSMQQAYYLTNIVGLEPQYFLDCSYTYHLEKWKTDVVLSGQNLLNNASYTQRFANGYQLVETSFEMRPRQFLLSTRFRF